MRTVVIVGVGLIGGSFALALRRAGFDGRIIGVSSPGTIEKAVRLGVIDEGLPLEEAAPQADLVYLSQPVLGILDMLPDLAGKLKSGALVTDAGSTKAAIANKAFAHLGPGVFLGGHPMAGKEKSGVEEAEATLFEGRVYALTPERINDLEHPVAKELARWIERIGSRVLILDADTHDRIVALTSHLGQLVSTALGAALEKRFRDQSGALSLAGQGLLDMTRLAMSPYEMWEGILKTNEAHINHALDDLIAELQTLRGELAGEAPRDVFQRGNALARQARES